MKHTSKEVQADLILHALCSPSTLGVVLPRCRGCDTSNLLERARVTRNEDDWVSGWLLLSVTVICSSTA